MIETRRNGVRSRDGIVLGVLAVELLAIVYFAATYDSLDFHIYMWGGEAVFDGKRLYAEQGLAHWFTNTPFAAVTFAPSATLPLVVARVLWQLSSVAAFAIACLMAMRLAGWRASRTAVCGVVAAGLALQPMYQTFFQGQVNLILLALILADVWRASQNGGSRSVGIGVGIAAAMKLTPGIFIVFLFVAGRTKAAVTAGVTFVCCTAMGFVVAPGASWLYWTETFYDTSRVGVPYISNQSPNGAFARLLDGAENVGAWYHVLQIAFAVAGLGAAAVLARHDEWLGAVAVTGTTGLLVSPISWAHHWVWVMPALVLLVRGGRKARIAAGAAYVLFVLAPFWWTPHDGGPREYGFHGLMTLVANCYLVAGLAFLGYMVRRACLAHRGGDSAGVAARHPRGHAPLSLPRGGRRQVG
ncbi:glycosyltransferase 87 family protein [Spirillospora sp. NPDC048911]|uniref:glycosyltransferase 87 family protein n=1 Tax=Spirillospora sp. NPDC048911 TaxID=3364527 RepID=UPI003716DFB9